MEIRKEILPVSDATIRSSARVMAGLKNGAYKEHYLSNAAIPFSEKEPEYLFAFLRTLDSLNFRYILDCKGVEDEIYCK